MHKDVKQKTLKDLKIKEVLKKEVENFYKVKEIEDLIFLKGKKREKLK